MVIHGVQIAKGGFSRIGGWCVLGRGSFNPTCSAGTPAPEKGDGENSIR